ncbi:hypothetical protein KUV23_17905 [Algoriphagus marincola]|uniref:Uncharacterized protein n=1 Tax=Algoriphagus marincola TaxID=264027 RepID=A0ABS7N942_9BACT|nr:hypothetical protein [Algoriphagus marincola]MBY5952861.1 hypothetical protein [Algoriphagus marincola]
MNMRFFLYLILLVIFSSCCDTHVEVTYEYEDVVIKRVDECGISTFYYGEISNNSPRVWATYSGINDGFSGYLVFGENQKVMILSGDGYFQSENIDSDKLEYNRISYEDVALGKGVYYIMLATNVEKERNVNTVSGVKVDYMD